MKKVLAKFTSKLSRINVNDSDLPSSDNPNPVPIVLQEPTSIGLRVIHDPTDAKIDLIAIHGQNGHPINSWTDRNSGALWLRDLLPGILKTHLDVNVRVLTYGYAALEPVETIGIRLMKSIAELRNETNSEGRKIIWCAHSFGGPLLQAAIGLVSPSRDIQTSTNAFLFFGVAKNMGLDALGTVLALPEATLSDEMRELRKGMLWLKMGGEGFERLCEYLGWKIVWFREVGDKEDTIRDLKCVDELGGKDKDADGKEDTVVRLEKTHDAMIKFASAEDDDFKLVVKVAWTVFQRAVR
ncbi:hypothetical protein EYC80_002789 [Monilinia laxa]|uniref:DUF676 domain-containing protein n=1 Tax=Monilinia laxa TaxID=61186 RepID=A0A5N6KBT1_MONLA|nr:hypothetical protein EYC80_002789 [Monilinia laxa]